MNWMKLWIKERDEAVRSLDVEKFKECYKKWRARGYYDMPLPSDDRVIEVSMRKMMFHSNSFSEQEKADAKKWLEDRGFSTDMGI